MLSSRSFHVPIAVVAATCCISGAALALSGNARSIVDLSPTGVWFPNDDADSVTHIGLAGNDATVTINRAAGALTVTELDGVAYVVDGQGRLSRVDPAILRVSQQAKLPSSSSQLVAGGGRLYVVDRSRGSVGELDPAELRAIGRSVVVGRELGRAVVDDDGVLWVPDFATGEVVEVEGGTVRSNSRVAEPGDDVHLSVVGLDVVAINADTATVTEVAGDRAGTRHTLAIVGKVDAPSLVAGTVLPVLSNTGLTTFDLASGETRETRLSMPREQLGTPLASGDKVYIPDFHLGALLVFDVKTGKQLDTITITGVAGRFELVVNDGRLFVNDPASERAWTLGPSGVLTPVTKYDPSQPGTGTAPNPSVPPQPGAPSGTTPRGDRGNGDRDGSGGPRTTQPDRTTTTTTTTTAPPVAPVAPTTTVPTLPVVVVPNPVPSPNNGTGGSGNQGNGNQGNGGQGSGGQGSGGQGNGTPPAPVTPPRGNGAVVGVAASAGDGAAGVSWQPPQNWRTVTGYRVRIEPGGETRDVDRNTNTLTVTGLTNGTTYTFTITARSASGNGQPVRSDGVTPNALLPDAPGNVVATAGEGQVTVSWEAPGGPRFTGFTVEVVPVSGAVMSIPVGASQTTATITGLANGASYHAVVQATVDGLAGVPGVSPSFVPRGRPGTPAVNGWVSAGGEITVNWTAAPPNGSPVTQYTISGSGLGSRTVAGDVLTTKFTGLSIGATHTFRVFATNDIGAGSDGGSQPIVVESQVPDAPGNVTAAAGDTTATVAWRAPSGNGTTIASYVVRDQYGGVYPVASGLSHVVTGLVNTTPYSFTVSAVGANGTVGPPGAAVPASVTPVGVPLAPTNVVVTPTSVSEVRVTFDAPTSSNGTPIQSWNVTTLPATTTVNVTGGTASVTGLVPGASYAVTVVAVPASGPPAIAHTTANFTMPTVPQAMTPIVVLGTGSYDPAIGAWVSIEWTPVAGATSYRIDPGDGLTLPFDFVPADPAATVLAAGWAPPYAPSMSYTVTVTPLNVWGPGATAMASYVLPPYFDSGGGVEPVVEPDPGDGGEAGGGGDGDL